MGPRTWPKLQLIGILQSALEAGNAGKYASVRTARNYCKLLEITQSNLEPEHSCVKGNITMNDLARLGVKTARVSHEPIVEICESLIKSGDAYWHWKSIPKFRQKEGEDPIRSRSEWVISLGKATFDFHCMRARFSNLDCSYCDQDKETTIELYISYVSLQPSWEKGSAT